MIQIRLDVGQKGVDLLLFVRVDHQTGPLVHQQDMFVFKQNMQIGLVKGQKRVFRRGGLEKLVVDIELQNIPLGQAGVPLGPLAVHLDPFQTDVLLGQGGGQERQILGQPAVQALSGVVFSDGKFFHTDGAPCGSVKTFHHRTKILSTNSVKSI